MDPLIEWIQTPNPLYPTCITGYVVTDQGNQSLTTVVDSTVTSLTAQQLNAAGFPYCISIHPTVTPLTLMGPLTSVDGSSNLYANLIEPGMKFIDCMIIFHILLADFSTPMLTYSFVLETGVVVLHVRVQVSERIFVIILVS